jgi:aryl-alcohol dehydrogenase-like predicted oxidoreductase
VIGPRRPAQLKPALDALDIALTPEEREAIGDEFRLAPKS